MSAELLLLHGFSGSGGSWGRVVPAFFPEFRPLTPDITGHGPRPAPRDVAHYTMPAVAAGLIAWLDAQTTVPVHLLGYSMGGRLALYLASHYPHRFRSLVLESASPGLATGAERAARRGSDEDLADWIEANGMEAFVDHWEQLPLFASQRQLPAFVRARLRQQRLQNQPHGLANSLRGMGTGAQPSLWERLGELAMPALLLTGAFDSKFVAIGGQMVAAMPQARLVMVENAGHTIHLEQPDLYIALLREFWSHLFEHGT